MENKRLFGKICAIQRNMSRVNNAIMSGSGVSPVQMQTLITLHRAEFDGKELCQKDIENELSMRPSSVSSMLVNLENGGYIERCYSKDSARTKIVTLTEKGRQLCIDNKKIVDECDYAVMSALTPEEQEMLDYLLVKILKDIDSKKQKNKSGDC